jgi:hypothetical protein
MLVEKESTTSDEINSAKLVMTARREKNRVSQMDVLKNIRAFNTARVFFVKTSVPMMPFVKDMGMSSR